MGFYLMAVSGIALFCADAPFGCVVMATLKIQSINGSLIAVADSFGY
jgi:hypothetical protein